MLSGQTPPRCGTWPLPASCLPRHSYFRVHHRCGPRVGLADLLRMHRQTDSCSRHRVPAAPRAPGNVRRAARWCASIASAQHSSAPSPSETAGSIRSRYRRRQHREKAHERGAATKRWKEITDYIIHPGRDPNWRTRPSILAHLRGWRIEPLSDNPRSASQCAQLIMHGAQSLARTHALLR